MIVSPDKYHRLDGSVLRIAQNINTELPIIPLTRIDDFVFNDLLLNYNQAVILDYCELDWNWDYEKTGSHIFGVNTNNFPFFRGEEWKKFDDWVAGLDKKIYFKREMFKDAYPDYIYPVDYPCWFQPQPIQSKEEFDSRPLSVFFFWGRSHEARLILHSNIWKAASQFGFSVCDNIYHLERFIAEEKSEKWATMWQPHYARVDISEILKINGVAKISVAMPGAGRKTFRGTGESPFNSIVLMHDDGMKYTYDWVDGVNCIKFKEFGSEIEAIRQALQNPNLYDIYTKSVENCQRYRIDNYVNNYLLPIINSL